MKKKSAAKGNRWAVSAIANGKTVYVLVTPFRAGLDVFRLDPAVRKLAKRLGGTEVFAGVMRQRTRSARSHEFLFRSKVRCARFAKTIDGTVAFENTKKAA